MTKTHSDKNDLLPAFQSPEVLTVAAGHFVHDVFSSFLAPWLPLLIEKLSLSLALAGSFTIFIRIPSLFNPFIGMAADRIDMRYMIIVAPAVTGACMSLIGLASSYGGVALLLFVAGCSASAFHVLGPVMAARASGPQVGKGMSFFMAGGELARTVGPLVAVAAVSLWGFEGSYPVMTLGFLASAFLWRRLRHAAVHSKWKHHPSLLETWQTMQHVLIPLTCLVVARALMVASLTAFLPTYMAVQGKPLWLGGSALAALEFAGFFGSLTSGTVSDRFGRRFVLLGAMVSSPALILIFLVTPAWIVFPVLLLLGFTVFATSPVMLAIVQEHAHGMQATANGIYMGINFVVVSGITVLVGWVGDLIGLRGAFAWSAVLALTGVVAVYFLPRRTRHVGQSTRTYCTRAGNEDKKGTKR
jgi:FSR family fosmidomycin resistance protein-like MFS transporter